MNALLRVVMFAAATGTALAQAPFNDSWERALGFGDGFGLRGTNAGATSDGSSACDVGASLDVWYVYTAEQSSVVRVITHFGIDTVLSLHRLELGQRLVPLSCNDDGSSPHLDSDLSWTAQAGVPYFLRLTGKNGQTGQFGIQIGSIARPVQPANASRETALSIWPGEYHGYSRGGTGVPTICQSLGEGLWFTYVPKTSGTASVSTGSTTDLLLDTQYDTAIDLEENGVVIVCRDTEGGPDGITFPVQAGAEYTIRIGSGGTGETGSYAMTLVGPECVGRTCDDPEPIAEGTHLVSLVGATASGSSNCSVSPEVARYFSYVAPSSGTLNVSTCGTTSAAVQGYAVDAHLSLHAGCPADPTSEVVCSTSSPGCTGGFGPEPLVSMPVTQGQAVLIRLAARADGQLTPIQLEISLGQSAIATCFGDGSGAACPCGNAGAIHRGCDNSFGAGGAQLFATGTASLSADTLSLVAADAPDRAPILLLQGDAVAGAGGGTPFADGLMCVNGTRVRLGGAISVDGASIFGAQKGVSLSVLGGLPAAGSTRWYQGFYRNDKAFCTPVRANLTNAVRVTWVP